MPPISATITSESSRARRNAIACLGGLGLVVLAHVCLGVAAGEPISLSSTTLVVGMCAYGPFAGVVVGPAVPYSVIAAGAALAWAGWIVALARGLLRALPWGLHLFLPIAWCVVGLVVGGFAALRYT
jgi:hypothetical protein